MWNSSHRITTEHWQNISYNQSCKKHHHVTGQDEREKKRNWDSTYTLGECCETGEFLSPWEPPSLAGRSARTERERQRFRGECSNWLVAGRAERDQHSHGHPAALPSLRHASAGVCRGWVLKFGLQRTNLGRGLGLALRRQPKETGVWPRPQLGVCAGLSPGMP